MGSGMNSGILALTVVDDGSGPALYAGGDFTIAGGLPLRTSPAGRVGVGQTLGLGTNARVRA
jgi:hypothetical protein